MGLRASASPKSVEHPLDAVAQVRHVEVNQQADFMITELQIRQNLRQVERMQFFHCFQLDDYASFNNEVDSIAGIDLNALMNDRQSDLMLKGHAIFRQLISQASVVSALETACSESGVQTAR